VKKKEKNGIMKVIAAFKEIASNLEFNIENTPVKPIKRLLRLFNGVEDMRVTARITYPLGELLLIAFLAILAGADTFVSIEVYCKPRAKLLRRFTKFNGLIPSHDTFRRVFSLLDPEALQKVIVAYLLDNVKIMRRSFGIDEDGLRHLCVDGKTANGTGRLIGTDREIPKIHTLHVYDNTNGICLVSKAVGEKTNEIPVAQEILKSMDLRDTIVTFDALNTQKATIAVIVEQKGHYLGGLKGNHPDFLEEVKSYFTSDRVSKIKQSKSNYLSYTENAHNCIERRSYWLSKNVDWLVFLKDWPNLRALIRYEKKSENTVTGKVTSETFYYISSLTDINSCADVIRGHWSVENLLHWHLDATLNEDNCQVVDRKAFQNMSLMRKLALSLFKLASPILKYSVNITRQFAGWATDDFLKILCAFDDDTIKDAMQGVDPQYGRKSRLQIPLDEEFVY